MKKNLCKLPIFSMLLGLIVFLAACSTDDNATTTEGTSKDKLTVAIPFVLGAPNGAPMWLGEGLGFFEEEGLDVEVIALPGKPSEIFGLVVAGKADVAISQPDTLVYPIAEGNDQGLEWVFTPYQAPIFGIFVEESSGIKSAKDLAGKKVGMGSLGAPFETFMRANVKADGGDAESVEAVAISSGSAAMEALKKGEIDAFVGNQGDIAIAQLATATEGRLLEFPNAVAEGFAAGFVMREDTDEAKRDVIARYIRAVIKSAIVAQENPEHAIEVNWEMYPASKPVENVEKALEEAKVSLNVSVSNYKKADNGQWGYINKERWEKFVANNGFTDKIPDVTILYDYSLLDKINDFDEEAVREKAKE